MGEVARIFEKAHAAVCGICGGARTRVVVRVENPDQARGYEYWCVHACMRCDTDTGGHGWGPPLFVAEWNERRE